MTDVTALLKGAKAKVETTRKKWIAASKKAADFIDQQREMEECVRDMGSNTPEERRLRKEAIRARDATIRATKRAIKTMDAANLAMGKAMDAESRIDFGSRGIHW